MKRLRQLVGDMLKTAFALEGEEFEVIRQVLATTVEDLDRLTKEDPKKADLHGIMHDLVGTAQSLATPETSVAENVLTLVGLIGNESRFSAVHKVAFIREVLIIRGETVPSGG